MSKRYLVTAELKDDKIKVTLGYMQGGSGHFVPLGYFENGQQAAHLATFVQTALHDEYERGLKDAYDMAIKSFNAPEPPKD